MKTRSQTGSCLIESAEYLYISYDLSQGTRHIHLIEKMDGQLSPVRVH